MGSTVQVDIVSAEEQIYSNEVEMVFAPAEMGEVGILPKHTPLLTRLLPGEVRVKEPEEIEVSYFVSGGLLEVQPDRVTVLADTVVRAEDLDHARAEEAKKRAEQEIQNRKSEISYAEAQIELARAVAELQVIDRIRQKKK